MRSYLAPLVLIVWAAWTIIDGGSLSGVWIVVALIAAGVQASHLAHGYREHHQHHHRHG